jgi:hypothetical protein
MIAILRLVVWINKNAGVARIQRFAEVKKIMVQGSMSDFYSLNSSFFRSALNSAISESFAFYFSFEGWHSLKRIHNE